MNDELKFLPHGRSANGLRNELSFLAFFVTCFNNVLIVLSTLLDKTNAIKAKNDAGHIKIVFYFTITFCAIRIIEIMLYWKNYIPTAHLLRVYR